MRKLRVDYFLSPEPTLSRLRRLAATRDPQRDFEKFSAQLLLAAIHRLEGDTAASDALLAAIPRGTARQLLYSPPFLSGVREHAHSPRVPLRVSKDFRSAWIDVAYWIGPDGRVFDVEVVRQGADPSWAEPLIGAIRARIYSAGADAQPSYRLERYTFTAPLKISHGTMNGMVRVAAAARVEYMDLTSDAEPGRTDTAGVKPVD
jgi:hypothetical protein